ncbi:Fe-S oxidoreductase [Thioflavicoccus mobilis 8321]|uniref:Glycolate oxidase iron-sulfur subunit n=1 Tax=Thioflavicoccus mobilis 8321 TaxID=765912 RepID=L0GXG5_9GAMM|nr:glycolate oxidase subunit GlcF [Thioflavicoccus mobilis]AGA90686.1 Fe-S oxidoreductase [Thioflavicoccus mobilis 8321]
MQTDITAELLETPAGREAEAILRACVHCGFCTATCPTYQLLGDEQDGPRGRIYQIKRVLEGHAPSRITQLHLDRCLSCRACETTCPSGVRYARLADIGRAQVDAQVLRPIRERFLRRALVAVLPHLTRLRPLLRLARLVAPLLPPRLRAKLPKERPVGARPEPTNGRRMVALGGCVQAAATPQTNAAAARLLAQLGIDLIEPAGAGCCGAVAYHLGDRAAALDAMRGNIDAWWPEIAAGAEAILVNASGCGAFIKEYGEILTEDSRYAEKAARVAELARDSIEVVAAEDLAPLGRPGRDQRIAFHAPCTLQHGQRLGQRVEPLLTDLGFRLTAVPDAHLCCGSAGTYSITQPELSAQLGAAKLKALLSEDPELIATANVGCQLHLAAGTPTPVVHWLELLAPP